MAIAARTYGAACILTLATSSQGLLTTASKTGSGYSYNFATVPLLAEALKLAISCYLLAKQKKQNPEAARITRSFRGTLLFLVPSLIYWVHNNVQFLTLKYVDPATYQILGNLKIASTAVLLWALLRRQLTLLQWIALVLLMIGATTSQLKTGCVNGDALFAAPAEGYLLGGLSAFLSGAAAVYTEWAMKRNGDSLYWQNCQLYAFGVACNALGLTLADLRGGLAGGLWVFRLFQGYNGVTVAVVANLALSGLLVSWVTKFADSILKVYATSMALLVTMAVSVVFFDLTPTLQLMLGILTASLSLLLYYLDSSVLTGHTPQGSPSKPLGGPGGVPSSAFGAKGGPLGRGGEGEREPLRDAARDHDQVPPGGRLPTRRLSAGHSLTRTNSLERV